MVISAQNLWRNNTNLTKSLSQKIKNFYAVYITHISNPDKDITRNENKRPIIFMDIEEKFLNKMLVN